MPLVDKVALVTGASRGIGKAIALNLGNENTTVIGTATTQNGANSISAYLEDAGIKGMGVVLDLTRSESIHDAISIINDKFGTITILVNNAGITSDNLFLRMKDEQWDKVIDTNLTGVFRITKACIKTMFKAKWGRIINLSSVACLIGNYGQTNYSAAKAGIIGFSKSLAREVAARGITVNVVAPGFIDTDMTKDIPDDAKQKLQSQIPLGKVGLPEDIAHAVAFLASENASYITGETLNVNGGLLMN